MRNLVAMMNYPTIYLERRDASRNMARFYALEIQSDLFGNIAAVRRWGRIGSRGRQSVTMCASTIQAQCAIEAKAQAKRRRGYRDC